MPLQLHTPRLLLRPFRDSDLDPLAAMCADPVVMKHFPSLQSREDAEAMYGRIQQHWNDFGYGAFALEIPGEHTFAGFVGFTHPRWEAHFTPCIEILWRLIAPAHGKGYCTEAASACLNWGFSEKGFTEVYSFTTPGNIPSWRVMEKIGMKREGEFDHPMVEEGHELRRHLLYRVIRPLNSDG